MACLASTADADFETAAYVSHTSLVRFRPAAYAQRQRLSCVAACTFHLLVWRKPLNVVVHTTLSRKTGFPAGNSWPLQREDERHNTTQRHDFRSTAESNPGKHLFSDRDYAAKIPMMSNALRLDRPSRVSECRRFRKNPKNQFRINLE